MGRMFCWGGGLGRLGRKGRVEGKGGRVLGVWLLQYSRNVGGWLGGLID